MSDFTKMLNDKMKKATEATRSQEQKPAAAPKPEKAAGAKEMAVRAPEAPTPGVEMSSPEKVAPMAQETRTKVKAPPIRGGGSNLNRVTVNLFDADRRALAIIKEQLANSGYDFTNRSDSIKIALRLAAKATKEELTQLLHEVRSEDRRFSAGEA